MKRRSWLGFAALCLLTGSGWIFDQRFGGAFSGLGRISIHGAALALLFAGISTLRGGPKWPAKASLVRIALGAAGMIAVPEVLSALSGGKIADSTQVLLFMLIPAVAVLTSAQALAGFGVSESPLRMLAPSLAALGGGALILPFLWPSSAAGRGWMVAFTASVLLSGYLAVRLHTWLADVGVWEGATLVSGSVAALSGVLCFEFPTQAVDASGLLPELVRVLAIEAPAMLLTVWLLRVMRPVSFGARFLLVPLVTLAESYLLLRLGTAWTTWLGIALLAGGSFALLREDSHEML